VKNVTLLSYQPNRNRGDNKLNLIFLLDEAERKLELRPCKSRHLHRFKQQHLHSPGMVRMKPGLPGSDGGFFLLKGSFFSPQSPRAAQVGGLGQSFSAICGFP